MMPAQSPPVLPVHLWLCGLARLQLTHQVCRRQQCKAWLTTTTRQPIGRRWWHWWRHHRGHTGCPPGHLQLPVSQEGLEDHQGPQQTEPLPFHPTSNYCCVHLFYSYTVHNVYTFIYVYIYSPDSDTARSNIYIFLNNCILILGIYVFCIVRYYCTV
jgi:hypothetical protein